MIKKLKVILLLNKYNMTENTENITPETYEFQAEINQLMNLIINAFYSNKDIFLRELISNASDAIDKIRYNYVKQGKSAESYEIKVSFDKENGLITIEDNGIGMTKNDIIANIGTVASSGTKQFMEALEAGNADVNLIGQFGVGFYSSYLVADKVTVETKHEEDQCYRWESDAGGTYTITPVNDDTATRGTRIILSVKEDQKAYLDEFKLRDIVKKHSQFTSYPIKLLVTKTETKEVDEDSEDDEEEINVEGSEDKKEDVKVENVDEGEGDSEESKKKKKTIEVESKEWELINTEQPIWCKSSSDVSEDEYKAFYKSISNDWDDYLAVKQFSAEGSFEFKGVLFIPKRAPFDMFTQNKKRRNLKLYVKKVFIMDDCEELVPEWLSFISGVVDSNDLPLNVSREILQQNKIMKVMRKTIIKKSLEMVAELAANDEQFKTFYESFSKNLKLGAHEETKHRDTICKYLSFYTNKSTDKLISLDNYIENMKEGQKDLYYIAGESMQSVSGSLFLEQLNNRGYQVLFMVEPIDEYLMQQLKSYKDHKFVNISKDELKLDGDEEKEKTEEEKQSEKAFCDKIKEILKEQVEKVVVSDRMVDSPACLVSGQFGWSANMERIMKAQALGDNNFQSQMMSKKTMEINMNHNIVKHLNTQFSNGEADSPHTRDIVHLLFDMSQLASGYSLDNIQQFTSKFYRMMEVGLGCNDETSDENDDLPPVENDTEELPEESNMEQVD